MKVTPSQLRALVIIDDRSPDRMTPTFFARLFWPDTWGKGGNGRHHALRRRAGGFLRRMAEAGLLQEQHHSHATFEYWLTAAARQLLTDLRNAGKLERRTKVKP